MRSSNIRRTFPFLAILLAIILIAGCTARGEKPTIQKKPPDSAKFAGYRNVAWATDGKRIYTAEIYGNGPKSWNSRIYSEKPNLSGKKFLARGIKTWGINLVAVSPKGNYLMFTRVVEQQQSGFAAPSKLDLVIVEVKTGKIVSTIPDAAPGGWKSDNIAWYEAHNNNYVVVKTVKVDSSANTELIRGAGIGGLVWSDDGRYFVYKVSNMDTTVGDSLLVLDTKTNTSSSLVESSGGYFITAVLNGNNVYYVNEKQGLSSLNISVIDISTKTKRGLWSVERPSLWIDEFLHDMSHTVSIRKLYLDHAKKNLIFYFDEREPQAIVYRLPIIGQGTANRIAILQANSGMGDNPFDYCAANNRIVWIEQNRIIKTKKLD